MGFAIADGGITGNKFRFWEMKMDRPGGTLRHVFLYEGELNGDDLALTVRILELWQ